MNLPSDDRTCSGCGYDRPLSHCHLCHTTDVPPLEHLMVAHPGVWADRQQWPDGAPVVSDTTLEPDDFGEAP